MNTIVVPNEPTAQPYDARPKNKLLRWTLRILVGLVIALVTLGLSGAVYQAIATEIDQRTYPAPGQMVDVGGYQLHIYCIGEGSPTVILEAAFPGTVDNWSWVQPEVAKATRVCAYDRAGMGWSDPGPEPRDAQQIASGLRTLLDNAGIEGPYVFAGHSLGGLFVRQYVAQYPDEVAGMVLVEATHPDVLRRLPPEIAAGFTPPEWQLTTLRILARIGVTRFNAFFPADPDLPAQQQAEVMALNASVKSTAAIAAELRAIGATTQQVHGAGDLGDMPLVVLTAGDGPYRQFSPELAVPATQVWTELQDDLVTLSSNSVHLTITGATHESLVYKQSDSRATSAAILQVVEAVRTNTRLTP
jgi:pimeloyl-ACP methyl ester carboxylesterase